MIQAIPPNLIEQYWDTFAPGIEKAIGQLPLSHDELNRVLADLLFEKRLLLIYSTEAGVKAGFIVSMGEEPARGIKLLQVTHMFAITPLTMQDWGLGLSDLKSFAAVLGARKITGLVQDPRLAEQYKRLGGNIISYVEWEV